MSEDIETKLAEFQENLMQNLRKNGFPGNPVGFPIDAVFEAASKKGFSFNKIRDRLLSAGVEAELEDTRIVFRPARAPGDSPSGSSEGSQADAFDPSGLDLGAMAGTAQEILRSLSPEKMQEMRTLLGNLDPSTLNQMKDQLAKMTDSEKQGLMDQLKGFLGKN